MGRNIALGIKVELVEKHYILEGVSRLYRTPRILDQRITLQDYEAPLRSCFKKPSAGTRYGVINRLEMLIYSRVSCAFSQIYALSHAHLKNFKTASKATHHYRTGIVSWGLLGPWGLHQGFVTPGKNDLEASWFAAMIEWLLWPGVALMVSSALTKFSFHAFARCSDAASIRHLDIHEGGALVRLIGLAVASALVVIAQVMFFGIHWVIATLAVPIAFLLAMVASRVVGETGIAPIGAIGKVSQLATGLTAPKVGHSISAPPQPQVVAQFFGSLIAMAVQRWQPTLAQRFLIAAASGLIAGESLAGVARALLGILG
jgi:hypothetical protein